MRNTIAFLGGFLFPVATLLVTNLWLNYEQISTWYPLWYVSLIGCFVWAVVLVGLAVFFVWHLSNFIRSINVSNFVDGTFWSIERDIHIERYQHLNEEITRYRDLASGKSAFIAWGVYAALIYAKKGGLEEISYLPLDTFFLFAFLNALSCSTLHLFCEAMIERNQETRRALEMSLSLGGIFRHRLEDESPNRPGFIVSILIIEFFIWAPFLYMIFFRFNKP